MRKSLVKITQTEREEALLICRRRRWLKHLEELTQDDEALSLRVKDDFSKFEKELSAWWNNINEKYKLESLSGAKWELDFETGIIILNNE